MNGWSNLKKIIAFAALIIMGIMIGVQWHNIVKYTYWALLPYPATFHEQTLIEVSAP